MDMTQFHIVQIYLELYKKIGTHFIYNKVILKLVTLLYIYKHNALNTNAILLKPR